MRPVSAAEAAGFVQSGDRIYVQGMAASPTLLLRALAARAHELTDVELYHLHIEGEAPHLAKSCRGHLHHTALFVGHNARSAVDEGAADYVPCFFSEIPALIRRGALPINIAFIHVSPPDHHGYCSLGTSVEAALAAVERASKVIALVNERMPRTHGCGFIHRDQLTAGVMISEQIHQVCPEPPDETEALIGKHVATLVEDGSTLQMGIGSIPNAVLSHLENHRDLGVHSEMFSDGLVRLIKRGAVTNRRKVVEVGKTVATFVIGSNVTYDFVDDNPEVAMLNVDYVNDTSVIRRNPKVTAINSAIEVDLSGQVCADSIGNRIYSGVGGQMDFIRGAALSEGGRPIIALPSRTSNGIRRIVSQLRPGAGVVTTRAHVHFVVTEYGCADLQGLSIRQRAKAMINIAHPDDRETLERESFQSLRG